MPVHGNLTLNLWWETRYSSGVCVCVCAAPQTEERRGEARRARGQCGSSNPPYSKVVAAVCVYRGFIFYFFFNVCLHAQLKAFFTLLLPATSFYSFTCAKFPTRSGCLRARAFPSHTRRGEGDVMFSLCLANPVLSIP